MCPAVSMICGEAAGACLDINSCKPWPPYLQSSAALSL